MLRAVANPAAGGQPGSFTTLTVSGAGTFGGNVTTAGDFVTTGDQFIRSSNGGAIASGFLLKGSTGEIIPYFGANPFGSWSGSGLTVSGLTTTDTLRVNVTPTAEVVVATHTAVFNINGTNYKFLCLAA